MASFNKHCIKGLHFSSYLSKLKLRQWQGHCIKSLLSRTICNQSVRTTCNQSNNFQNMTEENNCSKMKQDGIHVHFQSTRTRKSLFKYRRYCELCCYVRGYSTKTARFTLKNETYKEYLNSLEVECQELTNAQMSGERMGNEKSCRLLVLRKIVDIYEKLKVKYGDLEELNDMQHVEEMKELVKEEKQTCIAEIEELEEKLVKMVCPVEEVDDCDIILEIESGAGGQEAMLFVEEVFELYQKYAQLRGWQFEITQFNNAEEGVRKASAAVSGQGVYGELKYEGGIHRVQRVPKTESKGRVHTSTISVAILPQPKEIDSKINPNDVEITTMRSSGPGGQNVNKTNTAVRVKHIPTGFAVKCQVTRSQVKNMEMAFLMLKTKIFEQEYQKQMAQTVSQRKIQVGNKDRSEKIRTYNFSQDRITDHRLGYNFHNIEDFMSGGHSLQRMITQLQEEANLENLNILLQEFEEKHLKKKDRS